MIQNRVKELITVPANSIDPNPRNWRQHPDNQIRGLTAILEEIGIADVSVAYESESTGRLTYIDGHMREEILGDQDVPVIILDVTDEEAERLLLTMDPIGAMATTDQGALEDLLGDHMDSPLEDVLRQIAENNDISLGFDDGIPSSVTDDFALVKYEVMVSKSDNTPALHEALENIANTFGANFRVSGTV